MEINDVLVVGYIALLYQYQGCELWMYKYCSGYVADHTDHGTDNCLPDIDRCFVMGARGGIVSSLFLQSKQI